MMPTFHNFEKKYQEVPQATMKKYSIDLNCDLGESFGNFKVGNDEAIMPYISSCNIACGYHGGDPSTIEKTIALATKYKVSIGAHPSFPDLQGFGRRYMDVSIRDLTSMVKYQVAALKGMVESAKKRLIHVKAHGALYNAASENDEMAWAFIKAVAAIDNKLIIVGPPVGNMRNISADMGLRYVVEGFSDRNYRPDLTLVSRSREDGMITDSKAAVRQVMGMVVEGKIRDHIGGIHLLQPDTICIHGDQPNAVTFAKTIHAALKDEGYEIKSFASV